MPWPYSWPGPSPGSDRGKLWSGRYGTPYSGSCCWRRNRQPTAPYRKRYSSTSEWYVIGKIILLRLANGTPLLRLITTTTAIALRRQNLNAANGQTHNDFGGVLLR